VSNIQRNNYIFINMFMLMIALSSLMVEWATIKATYPSQLAGVLLTITGTNGKLGWNGLTLSIWVYIASSVMGLITSTLIIIEVISISKIVPIGLMSIGLLGSLFAFFLASFSSGSLGIGPFLLLIASGTGIGCLIHQKILSRSRSK
jgi:hypothetical protein